MADSTVLVGSPTPIELPRGSATVLVVQNQSARRLVKCVVAADATAAATAAGPILQPFEFGQFSSLSGSDKVWGFIIGNDTGETVPMLVSPAS